MTQSDTLIQAIRDGHRFSKKMAAHTGIPQSNIYTLLSQLKGKGEIVGNGVTGYYTRAEEEAKHGESPARAPLSPIASAPAVLARAVEEALADDDAAEDAGEEEGDEPAPASARLAPGHPWRNPLPSKKFTEPTQQEMVTVCEALLFDKPEWGAMPRALLETITKITGAAMAATLQTLTEKGILKEGERGFEIASQTLAEDFCGYKKPASYPANVATAEEKAPTPASLVSIGGIPTITSGEELDRIRDNAKADAARRQQAKVPAIEITDISSKDPLPVPVKQQEKEWEWVKDSMSGMTIDEHGALTLLCKDDKIELSVEETKRVFAFLCLCSALLEIPK